MRHSTVIEKGFCNLQSDCILSWLTLAPCPISIRKKLKERMYQTKYYQSYMGHLTLQHGQYSNINGGFNK